MPTQPQTVPVASAPVVNKEGQATTAWFRFFAQMAAVVSYTRVGTGDPEGIVAAPVGATYQRTDGGAGTTFYVKESGAGGNTGWVGK